LDSITIIKMMDKEVLVNTIKEWIQIDNEMKELQKGLRERRERKKELTNDLVNTMKQNEIDCFDINDGKLVYSKNTVKSSINKKHILNTIGEYFRDTPEQAKELCEHILNTRSEVVKETIKRKIVR
jgi:seryl-tRNA synthetase